MINYTEMTATQLKEIAKEKHIKNWWLLKKAELVEQLSSIEEETPELPELTDKEKAVLLSIQKSVKATSKVDEIMAAAVEVTGLSVKSVGGVFTSLVSKDLVGGSGVITKQGMAVLKELKGQEPQKFEEDNTTESGPDKNEDNLITLKDILVDLKLKGTKARRILRGKAIERPYKRWEWDKDLHKEIIDQVIEILKASVK